MDGIKLNGAQVNNLRFVDDIGILTRGIPEQWQSFICTHHHQMTGIDDDDDDDDDMWFRCSL